MIANAKDIALAIKLAHEQGHHPVDAAVTPGDVLQEVDLLVGKLVAYGPTILAILKELQALTPVP